MMMKRKSMLFILAFLMLLSCVSIKKTIEYPCISKLSSNKFNTSVLDTLIEVRFDLADSVFILKTLKSRVLETDSSITIFGGQTDSVILINGDAYRMKDCFETLTMNDTIKNDDIYTIIDEYSVRYFPIIYSKKERKFLFYDYRIECCD